jgi:mono/diheme cytochrome c family protein
MLVAFGVTGLFACGGESTEGEPNAATTPPAATPPSQATQPGAPDPALAEQGEQLFTQRACNACHTIGGGRLVGPDLTGVTERREYGWILAMITNPDSMIRADSIAKGLFAEYMTPMANQNLTLNDAAALYEFLRSGGVN